MKFKQRGDAGAVMLVMLVVIMGIWFWHGGMWHGGERGHMSGPADSAVREKSAIELLDEAYVRGEITREEYLRKRDDLLKH